MKLHDVVTAPWAITPDMFAEVQSIYARHLRGEKIDVKALEAKLGGPLPGPTRGYEVVNGGVAVLPIDGVLAKRMTLLSSISGGSSMQVLADDFRAAMADQSVNSIILCIDSPGGTVDGCQELSNLIYEARGQKPVIALADGCMASAAYWIGSAADMVFASSDTAQVGSIGVVSVHTDVSRAQNAAGVKTTEITAGKYKRIASQFSPLSDEGRQSIQDQVDYTYSIFVDDVARNRETTSDAVLKNMADGRIFLGRQAQDAGLVDGIATLDQLIERAAAGEFSASAGSGAKAKTQATEAGAPHAVADQALPGAAVDNPEPNRKDESMDVQKLKAEHPEIAAALIEEGRQAGATTERERIQSVEAQSMPGHEALIATMKFDGKTSGPEAAVAVLSAEKTKRSQRLENLAADANDAKVKHAASPQPGDEDMDEECEDDSDDDASASPSGGKSKKKARGEISNLAQAGVIANKAQLYMAEQAAKGVRVSASQAVAHVSRN